LPTKTQALPLEDDISLPSIPELDDSESPPLLHTLSLPRDEEPLSPVSPEWATNGIPPEISPSPEHSFLLHRSCCNNFDYLLGYPTPASSSSSRPLSPPQDQLDLYSPTRGRDFSSPLYIESELDAAISPLLKSLDLTPEDAQLPSSPFVHSFPLPGSEDDDIEDQFLHTHDSYDTQYNFTDNSISPPPSPGQSLSPLPDADLQDNFYFPESPETKYFSYSPLRGLPLLGDPNDVPPPRSPPPEPFQLDPSQLALEGCTGPDIQHLCDIRKKSQSAERAARALEAQALELGGPGVGARWEARQKKKQEKGRGREA
jgi:hypothetical protein